MKNTCLLILSVVLIFTACTKQPVATVTDVIDSGKVVSVVDISSESFARHLVNTDKHALIIHGPNTMFAKGYAVKIIKYSDKTTKISVQDSNGKESSIEPKQINDK